MNKNSVGARKSNNLPSNGYLPRYERTNAKMMGVISIQNCSLWRRKIATHPQRKQTAAG